MSDLDYRSRFIGALRRVEPEAFFLEELPEALKAHGDLVAAGAERLGLPPLALSISGEGSRRKGERDWTLTPGPEGLGIERGSQRAEVVAELDERAFSELIDEEKSTLGLVFGGRARVTRGESQAFVDWDTLLRTALDGRPVYAPGSVAFGGREPGESFDLNRSFELDDDPAEMRHFLEQAGFLHLRGVFEAAEMERVSREIDAASATASPSGEDGTWWVGTRSRGQVAARLLEFQDKSPTLRALLEDERFTRIGRQLGMGHLPGDSFGEHLGRVSAEALIKPWDVVEGIADLTWHKDCARGGHSRHCCALTAGIAVTPASRRDGQLHVIAGSHRISVPVSGLSSLVDLPDVALETGVGDVTLHSSCTLHMSERPERGERRVVYSGFTLPPRPEDARGTAAGAVEERSRVQAHTRAALKAGR